jgi:biopolymer transport protein ExbD
MAFSAQARSGVVAEMNITPLVDVMLVLLIIFMVAVPMLSKTFELNLPQVGPEPPPPSDVVTLQIDAGGALTWEGHAIPAFAVDAAMRAEAGRKEPPVLNIEADPDAPYQSVADAMARAQRAGLEKIALN